MKISRIKLITFSVIFGISQAQSNESKLPNVSPEDFQEILTKAEKCKGNNDPNCLIDTLAELAGSINIELYTACSISPNFSPQCSEVIPDEAMEEHLLIQTCLENPNDESCKVLPEDLQEYIRNIEPAFTPEEIAAVYEEGYQLVLSCVNGSELKNQKYLNLNCSEVVPHKVILMNHLSKINNPGK